MSKKLYFLGICGSAVGNVAIALKQLGYDVRGSDQAAHPPMGERLEESGISIDLGYETSPLPDDIDLVVVGNVISRGNATARSGPRSPPALLLAS